MLLHLIFLEFFLIYNVITAHKAIITNHQDPCSSSQLGDSIINYYVNKLLYLKNQDKLTFYYSPFRYANLFFFDEMEEKLPVEYEEASRKKTKPLIKTEKGLQEALQKYSLISGDLAMVFDSVSKEESFEAKKWIKLKENQPLDILPRNIITVAVHIRKGNGGGEQYDGEMKAPQIYKLKNKEKIIEYFRLQENYQFEFEGHCITTGNRPEEAALDRGMPFVVPPEQYYIDQIFKLSDFLHNVPLHIQIFTDDKNPLALVNKIKKHIKKSNITIAFHNNKNLSFTDRMTQDLHLMSQCDVLIRSQSNFAKIAELLGNHRLIFYPVGGRWIKGFLVMSKIIIKGPGFV